MVGCSRQAVTRDSYRVVPHESTELFDSEAALYLKNLSDEKAFSRFLTILSQMFIHL
jgi:hypothetical protein